MSSDADVLAEIARLSSAIDQHKQSSAVPTRGRGRGRGRGSYRGRGRGAAAGGSTHRNATWVAPHLPQPPSTTHPSTSRSGTTTPVERGSMTPMHASSSGASIKQERAPPPPPREVTIDSTPSTSTSTAPVPSTSTVTPTSGQDSTPRRTSHLGTTYIRTKSGNLVSLAFARDRKLKNDLLKAKKERLEKLGEIIGGVQGARNKSARGKGTRGRGRGGFNRSTRIPKPPKPKSDKLCIFFQKTGQCSRAHTCRYVHDSTKISICPLFLRSSCPRTASTCPLSHHPNAHRSPHCSHFPSCTRPACPYAHVVVSQDAKVCREFVEYGWCEKGEECDKRHVRECWRFSEEGKCDVVGCKEPHILRRVHSQESEDEDEENDDDDDEGEEEGEEDAQEEVERDAEEELSREEKGIKRKRAAGISGEAGRRLMNNKKLKKSKSKGGLQDQQDFVQLSIPASDLEDEDEGDSDEDGMSVDSDDLADEEEGEDQQPLPANPEPTTTSVSTSTSTSTAPPTVLPHPSTSNQTPPVKKVIKRRHYDQPPAALLDQTDELDYGLSSDDEPRVEDQAQDEGEEAGDETIYLEASEGLDLDESEAGQEEVQGAEEEEDSDDEDDTDVANLLRR
ncbi:uncharacterized protein JCM6883_001092 [Sporobolomyces salmoneus]|uniref:uncharacterized protein n=1 Tax=Sporobolomyces salmoneus TaxID=183962 RepID=UPI0031827B07